MINETIIGEFGTAKIWASDLEDEARIQIENLTKLPFIYKHIAVMPDAHAGCGSTIGTVIATKGAIIPAAVGVDIGCGMCAVKLPFKIDKFGDNLSFLRSSIERSIPVGFNQHKTAIQNIVFVDERKLPPLLSDETLLNKARLQIGTLGGGNHFIEICKDQNDDAWVMLHSGSRNIGKVLAECHIDRAKGLMKDYFIDIPHPDLSYLVQNSKEFNEYIDDLLWAQDYAKENRNQMMKLILKDISHHIFGEDIGEPKMTSFRVDCHHNYCSMENHFGSNVWVTRKGAVSAKEGQYGIIPGSMGKKSFIVKGKGNPYSFNSCSHGAGRKMSRKKAKLMFTEQDLIEQTKGIECRKDKDVIDEIPSAYKDIDEVMKSQEDLVESIYELNQLICIKG
jgi:tRNA-splicing ligase RtcB